MIKLQVDHNKHPPGSGAKLQLGKSKDKKGSALQAQPAIVQEQKSPKAGKKQKEEKQDKKDKKQKEKGDKKKDKKQEELGDTKSKGKKDKQKGKDKQDKKDKDKKDKKDKKNRDKMSSSILKENQDKEDATIKNINKSQQRAKLTIQELIQQYKDAAEKLLFNNHGSDPDKESQIQRQLARLQQAKEQRHQKIEQLEKHKQQIEQSRLRRKQAKKELRKEKEHEKKIERIEEKLKSIQETSEERKKDYSKFLEYVKQRKNFVPRFKRYEQQYKKKLLQQNQKSQQLIQQVKKTYVPMSLEEINQFQEHYMSQKQQSENYRYNKLRLEQDMIHSQNQKMKKSLWRGKCHQIVKQQLIKQQEKKQADFVKEQNRKQFGNFIKEKLLKSIQNKEDQEKGEEQQETSQNKLHLHVREKYIKGVNYGLVKEEKVVPLDLEQKAKLGNQYLAQIKELNKHRKNKTVDYNTSAVSASKHSSLASGSNYLSDSQELRGKSKTYKLRRKSNPYYPSQGNRASLDLNNYQSIEYTLEKIETANRQKKLQDQIIKHGQYQGVLQIQERKQKAGSIVVKQINQKLKLLQKL